MKNMPKQKIMPGIGCLNRRIYIEYRNRVNQQGGYIEPNADPCIMCGNRSDCIKSVVAFC